jgi:hypothetical protein
MSLKAAPSAPKQGIISTILNRYVGMNVHVNAYVRTYVRTYIRAYIHVYAGRAIRSLRGARRRKCPTGVKTQVAVLTIADWYIVPRVVNEETIELVAETVEP